MKIAKKKVKFRTLFVNAIMSPGNNDSGSYDIRLAYYGRGSPAEWLVCAGKLLKVLDGQSISTGSQQQTFTERVLASDAKATLNHAALKDIDICTADNSNKVQETK